MKKFLFIALISALTFSLSAVPASEATAQSTNTITRTIAGVDTALWNATSVGSDVRGFQYTALKSSGTVAGKVILEGTINGTWVGVDSLTLADVTYAQTKVTSVAPTAGTTYRNYRYRCTNTSAATIVITATYIKRSDD